jgi:hypothetical protein
VRSKSGVHFCSIEHANQHQASIKQTKCEDCGKPIWSNNQRCMDCYKRACPSLSNQKKSEVKHASIRNHARRIAKKHGLVSKCANLDCGYTQHVQACHRKPVADFGPDSLLSEINDPSNLVGLCAMCHWEYDHGVLILGGSGLSTPTQLVTQC